MTYSHPYQLRADGLKTRTYKTEESARIAGDALALDLDRPVTLTYHAAWWSQLTQEVVRQVRTLEVFQPKHNRPDTESSRSSQHFIDTSRYLTYGETEREDLFDEYRRWEADRTELSERQSTGDIRLGGYVSPREWHASDAVGFELLRRFRAALGRC